MGNSRGFRARAVLCWFGSERGVYSKCWRCPIAQQFVTWP
jgi:hypothetical protein